MKNTVLCTRYFSNTKHKSREKILDNVFQSNCNSHAKLLTNLRKIEKRPKMQHKAVMHPALQLFVVCAYYMTIFFQSSVNEMKGRIWNPYQWVLLFFCCCCPCCAQHVQVIRASDWQSRGLVFKSRSDHYLELFLDSPVFNSLALLVNSQLVCLLLLEFLTMLCCIGNTRELKQ